MFFIQFEIIINVVIFLHFFTKDFFLFLDAPNIRITGNLVDILSP